MFNVRTLYQTGKLDQLLCGAQNLPLGIIGIQEHQYTNGLHFHNTGMTSASLCSSILLPSNLRSVLLGYWFAKSSQTHTWLLRKSRNKFWNPLIVVYVIYAPSNVANDSDKAAFFNDLHKVSKEQPHSIVIMHDPDPRTTSRLRSSNFSLLWCPLSSWPWCSSSLLWHCFNCSKRCWRSCSQAS